MREWADFTVQEAGGRTTIVLQGPLLVSSIGVLDRRLREFDEPVQFIDLSGAGAIDTVGAWTVVADSEVVDGIVLLAPWQVYAVELRDATGGLLSRRRMI